MAEPCWVVNFDLQQIFTATSVPCMLLFSLGNETIIFVTMFCGYINVKSGDLIYSNGGHCAPIVSSQGHNRFITLPKRPLVGAFSGVSHYAMEDKLLPGDLLFCYTDGVTEAQNPSGEEFPEKNAWNISPIATRLPYPHY